jgi:hypothetical protein
VITPPRRSWILRSLLGYIVYIVLLSGLIWLAAFMRDVY